MELFLSLGLRWRITESMMPSTCSTNSRRRCRIQIPARGAVVIDRSAKNQEFYDRATKAVEVFTADPSSCWAKKHLASLAAYAQRELLDGDDQITDLERAIANASVQFPIGQIVHYYPVKGRSMHVVAQIRSEPWALGHGEIVIKINGRTGGVSIDHLEVI